MGVRDQDLRNSCRIALNQCLAIKPEETVLIITDSPLRDIAYAFFEEAQKTGDRIVLVEMVRRNDNEKEPPAVVAQMMKSVDVIVAPTSRSLSHTAARRAASKAGVRAVTLPGVSRETLTRGLNIDYSELSRTTRKLAGLLSAASGARLTCPLGTDLTLSLRGRSSHFDIGLVHEPGAFSNLPAGEAFIAPVEGTAQGRVVFRSSLSSLGGLKKSLTIEVEDGEVMSARGEKAAKLMAKIEAAGKPGRNIAELGVGTNPKAILSGRVIEDEKVYGTTHIAIGDNRNFGGKTVAPHHLDGIIVEPTLWLDGKKILTNRKLSLD